MTRWRRCSGLLILSALVAHAALNAPVRAIPAIDGYLILAADFHVHSFPGDWATLAPWDVMREAQRSGLDVIALTSHNHVWAGQLGRWLSAHIGGPMVLEGEEIVGTPPHYHLIAAGIRSTVDWRLPAAAAIDEIHAQGGVAIAAHPLAQFWPSFDTAAMQRLDGAEVLHPVAYEGATSAAQLRDFYDRGNFAAIGDSDYRGLGPAGICRTYVFARERSERAVLQAIREHHTVVYDRGAYYGDPHFIEAIRQRMPSLLPLDSAQRESTMSVLDRVAGECGLILAVLFGLSVPAGTAEGRTSSEP